MNNFNLDVSPRPLGVPSTEAKDRERIDTITSCVHRLYTLEMGDGEGKQCDHQPFGKIISRFTTLNSYLHYHRQTLNLLSDINWSEWEANVHIVIGKCSGVSVCISRIDCL